MGFLKIKNKTITTTTNNQSWKENLGELKHWITFPPSLNWGVTCPMYVPRSRLPCSSYMANMNDFSILTDTGLGKTSDSQFIPTQFSLKRKSPPWHWTASHRHVIWVKFVPQAMGRKQRRMGCLHTAHKPWDTGSMAESAGHRPCT